MHLLVRIFLREDEEFEGEPLYVKLVKVLKERGIAGATVLKALLGYGTTGEYHYEGIEILSYNLPVVVEFVDEENKVMAVLDELGRYIKGGLITMERVRLWDLSLQ